MFRQGLRDYKLACPVTYGYNLHVHFLLVWERRLVGTTMKKFIAPLIILLASLLGSFSSHAEAQERTTSEPQPSIQSAQIALTPEERDWLVEHPVIEIGVMDSWPPMDFVDLKGTPQGIGAKFVHALNKRLGGVLRFKSGPWSDIYQDVKEKRLAGLMGITPRPDREEFFHFTTPYVTVPHVIIARKDSPHANSLGDLADKKVAVEKGFFITKVLADNIRSVCDRIDLSSPSNRI